MRQNVISKWTASAAFLLPLVTSLPFDHLDDQVNAAIDAGTFQNPSSNIRPKFRYWLPDASVNVTSLADDIASIASVGAGAIEFLNYWLYGGASTTQPVVPVDWDTFNFGTPIYNTVLIAALQACKDNGILFDYEVGVQSGQGAPAEIGNPGLAWFLTSNFDIIAPGGNFTGIVPGFGSGELVAVGTAEVLEQTAEDGFTLYTVTESSLQDITSQVGTDGSLNITFPVNTTVIDGFLVYASYASQPLIRSGIAGPDPMNFIQNGSFAVDHFSPVGAQVTTDFLEQFVLINGAKELLMEVGNYIWEDSIEIQGPGAYWTPNLTTEFEAQHGYSFLPFLPLIARLNENAEGTQNSFAFQTNSTDAGASYVNDFRATLTAGYLSYVQFWTNWSNTFLDLQSSAQIGYNLPVDALSNVPFINAPEGETLAFVNDVDEFRQYCEAANLAGKRVISVELAADRDLVYQLTFPTLLQNAGRAISGGVNTFVIHGSPYSHSYPNTTWPGYTTFTYAFSEMHGRHQPAWENGYHDVLDWFARSSFVLQSGIPKRDVVFYEKLTTPLDEPSFPHNYMPNDLVDAGYAYGYLSPDNFQLPQAVVTDGVLALDGPAYRALIIRQNDTLTVDGVSKIAEFANAGLPIIVAGGFPAFFSPQNATAVAFVNTTLTSISTLPSVHIVADIPVASVLQSIGIVPRTQVSSNSTWEVSWRDNGTSEYIFIFNDGGDSVGSIKFNSTATPFFFDAWTGVQSPVLNYTLDTTDQTTEIALSLKENEMIIVAFTNDSISGVEVPPVHFTSAPSSVLGFSYSNATGLIAKIPASTTNTTGTLTTSDGAQTTFTAADVPAAFQLSDWDLIAEHWDPPANLSDVETIAVKSNTTHTNLTYPLLDWNSIPGLANTSGLGFYNSSFTWPPSSPTNSSSTLGAILTFSPIIHTITLTINSILLPPIDPLNPTVDISAFLVNGTNVVEAKIATVIYNALVPILTDLQTAASGLGLPLTSYPPFVEVGLVGSVVVTPFVEVVV
jgi:hypothetical protein